MSASTPEGKVKAKFKRGLKKIPRVWSHMSVQTGMGAPTLDFVLCVDGLFVAVEAKATAKHQLSALQQQTVRAMEGCGAVVFIVHDENVELVLNQIGLLASFPKAAW